MSWATQNRLLSSRHLLAIVEGLLVTKEPSEKKTRGSPTLFQLILPTNKEETVGNMPLDIESLPKGSRVIYAAGFWGWGSRELCPEAFWLSVHFRYAISPQLCVLVIDSENLSLWRDWSKALGYERGSVVSTGARGFEFCPQCSLQGLTGVCLVSVPHGSAHSSSVFSLLFFCIAQF